MIKNIQVLVNRPNDAYIQVQMFDDVWGWIPMRIGHRTLSQAIRKASEYSVWRNTDEQRANAVASTKHYIADRIGRTYQGD